MLTVETYPLGYLGCNSYIVTDGATGESLLVDVGVVNPEYLAALEGKNIKAILLTHCHFDHISGVEQVKRLTGARVYIHESEQEDLQKPEWNLSSMEGRPVSAAADRTYRDGDVLPFAGHKIKVLHTPGHSRGSVCLLLMEHLFSGDTLFLNSIGRTDFPTSSPSDMTASLEKLKALSGDYKVYPGHGPGTTLLYEKRCNPYMSGNYFD